MGVVSEAQLAGHPIAQPSTPYLPSLNLTSVPIPECLALVWGSLYCVSTLLTDSLSKNHEDLQRKGESCDQKEVLK